METLLSVASFAISLGGLVPALLLDGRRKEIVLTVVVGALVATSGIGLYRVIQHDRQIARVEHQIVLKLAQNTWTFDQLYHELHYIPLPVVNEALFQSVERGAISYRTMEFRSSDGSMLETRAYYVD